MHSSCIKKIGFNSIYCIIWFPVFFSHSWHVVCEPSHSWHVVCEPSHSWHVVCEPSHSWHVVCEPVFPVPTDVNLAVVDECINRFLNHWWIYVFQFLIIPMYVYVSNTSKNACNVAYMELCSAHAHAHANFIPPAAIHAADCLYLSWVNASSLDVE